MKRTILLVVLATAMTTMKAQKVRLNFYGSYVFDDGYNVYNNADEYYNGKVSGGFQWGGGIAYLVDPSYGIELMYLRQSTHAPTTFKVGSGTAARTENFDAGLNYIMVVGERYLMSGNKKIEGYGGLMIGMLISNIEAPSTGGSSNNTNLAWGARLGANIWASRRVGIKLQAQLLSASRATGGSLYFGFYGPVVVPSYSSIYQFGLGGGLTFKLGYKYPVKNTHDY